MRLYVFIGIVFGVMTSCDADKLPPYIKKCKADDWKCALESANAAVPHFMNGDKKYRVPSLNPELIPKIEIEQGGLKLKLENVKLYFTEDVELKYVKFDLKNKILDYRHNTPRVRILADYEISGKILLLPVSAKGKSNLTVINMDVRYQCTFVIRKGSDGQEYIKFDTGVYIPESLSRAYYDFTNLFNGEKPISDVILNFMNENWKDIYDELSPVLFEALAVPTTNILNIVVEGVPLGDIFLQ